jgi:hypothetical protein
MRKPAIVCPEFKSSERISGRPNHSTQMKSLLKECQSLSFGTLICLLVAHKPFNFLCKQTADGSLSACGQNLGFPEHLPAQAYRNVLFRAVWQRHKTQFLYFYV